MIVAYALSSIYVYLHGYLFGLFGTPWRTKHPMQDMMYHRAPHNMHYTGTSSCSMEQEWQICQITLTYMHYTV